MVSCRSLAIIWLIVVDFVIHAVHKLADKLRISVVLDGVVAAVYAHRHLRITV